MLAFPYREELRAQAVRGFAAVVLMFAAAVTLFVAAGRLEDLNLRWLDALWVAGAVLIAATLYSLLGDQVGRRLDRMRPLTEDVRPTTRSPRGSWLWALGAGLLLGGVALVIDFELDNLAVVVAIVLGGILGGPAMDAWRVGRHEREHGGTVYRLEDPPGTEAGLGWLPQAGE